MKTVTIILPDEFICCSITAIALRECMIHTFVNCFNVKDYESQAIRIQLNDDKKYQIVSSSIDKA